MDAFEDLIARLLRNEGRWTVQGYKINLTAEQKKALDNPFMPRPEVDIVAYHPADNELWWVECKSYLDSAGVRRAAFEPGGRRGGRFRVFTDSAFRDTATTVLNEQLIREG